MSRNWPPDEEDPGVKIRSIDLDTPVLVDQIGAALLNHLIACRTCASIFAAQKQSIVEAGCVEGRRILSESNLAWQERRSKLALGHLTEQTLEDYLFDRFAPGELQAIEHHISCCSRCAQEIRQRETLIALIKAVLSERQTGKNPSSTADSVVQVRIPRSRFSMCFKNKLGKDE